MKIITVILFALLLVMSLVCFIFSPVAGIVGLIVFAVSLFLVKSKKKKKPEADMPATSFTKPDDSTIQSSGDHSAEPLKPDDKLVSHEINKCAVLTTKVAGVKFKNDDGSSRQEILSHYYQHPQSAVITLDRYIFKDQDAVSVLCCGEVIGNVPEENVTRIIEIWDRIQKIAIEIDCFEAEDEEKEIYFAKLTINYLKKQFVKG